MTLLEKISEDLDNALRNQDQATLSTLRLIKSSLKNEQISKKTDLSDEDVVKILQKEAKQRRDSITSFKAADRTDLVEKEEQELKILETYLPQQLSNDELAKLVDEAVAEGKAVGMQDMGKIMGLLAPKTTGRADGGKVAAVVKAKLQSLWQS